jgi:hypothetical protein
MYDAYASRERQESLLPQSMKNIIKQIGQSNQKLLQGASE